jgi:NAD(P)H-dependent FMN reductase
MKKSTPPVKRSYPGLLTGVIDLLERARRYSARSVNVIMTAAYWEIGLLIVEHEQQGHKRASYGDVLLKRLASDLSSRYGRGLSRTNLQQMREFYLSWPIRQTLSGKLASPLSIGDAPVNP